MTEEDIDENSGPPRGGPGVLVLNRNWQAISIISLPEALCRMATGSALGLKVEPDGRMEPAGWREWLTLPVREGDRSIGAVRGPVRAPAVVVLSRYDRVPLHRPALSARAIRERDGHRCQYTGRRLAPHEGSVDHVFPRCRGGPTSWTNCVLAHRDVNARKGGRTPEEAGLRLLRQPQPPRPVPVTVLLSRRRARLPEWEPFLIGGGV